MTNPKIKIPGVRGSIPSGFLLGRTSSGSGDVELIRAADLGKLGSGGGGGGGGGNIQTLLDGISNVQGTVLYRSATQWSALAPGVAGQVLETGGAAANPSWATSPLILGSGVPSALEPAGTLYSRTDAAGVYSSQPTNDNAAFVQSGHTTGHGTTFGGVTMGAAVTSGNLLLAFVGMNTDQSAFITGSWTLLHNDNSGNTSNISWMIAYRYATGGDGTAPPNVISGAASTFWGLDIVEISGVSGTIGLDLLGSVYDHNGSTFNTSLLDTTQANQFSMLVAAAYDATAVYGVPTGWTSKDNWNLPSNYGSMLVATQTPVSLGTNVGGATITRPAGSSGNNYAATFIFNSGLTPNWVLIGP